AEGPERVDAEVVVVDVGVPDVAEDVDLVEDLERAAEDLPGEAVGFGALEAQVADVAVDDVHARLVRGDAVGVEEGARLQEAAARRAPRGWPSPGRSRGLCPTRRPSGW